MNDREHRSDHESENGYGFGAARDRSAPLSARNAQYGRNQSARMRNAYPENEVGYVERPEDRTVESPDSDALSKLITERSDPAQQHSAAYGNSSRPPSTYLIHRSKQVLINLRICR